MTRRSGGVVRTEILVIGSGAGGATTAARLAEAGRDVVIVEEGPDLAPGSAAPFSLEEMATRYRHRGLSAALGAPGIVYAEGRCVGGSTEINSGLFRRMPTSLAEGWRTRFDIRDFEAATLGRYSDEIERELDVSTYPFEAPVASAVLERGAGALGWRAEEFARTFAYDERGVGHKQSMARTLIPRARQAGATVIANCTVRRVKTARGRATEVWASLRGADDRTEPVVFEADHVFVCGGAVHTPALLQRSGVRRAGRGLKFHPTIKVAARFPFPVEHADVPMHRITQFAPGVNIGGSASRRGHVALALADTGLDCSDALADWENVAVYYAAIRSDAHGTVFAVPGMHSPVVFYQLHESDMSRLARGIVHLGEALLAAGATELYPGLAGGPIARTPGDIGAWWDAVSRDRSNVMTVHLTSTVRMGENQALAVADSYGRVHGYENFWVNDASLLPDAPGVNPQAAIMAIAARNADYFLTNH
jgi:choline dehydrogenase-like flavoprotein